MKNVELAYPSDDRHPGFQGFTKREKIAAMMMQGVLSSASKHYIYDLAELSVKCADALLKELNK